MVDGVAVALAGSAGARLLSVLHHDLTWASVLNCLMRITLPDRPTPQMLGIDEFALRRGRHYATILIDAATGERVEVPPDRNSGGHRLAEGQPGIEIVCRDGAGGFARPPRPPTPRSCRWETTGICGTAWPRPS
ncbi:hypothetical protein ACFYN3_43200 [Streptomyces lavendulae]|uniref:hypothetical protein n=1 Tax=Streptomyces lavendulae TaxID=1914 RepID=UPI00369DCE66